MTKTTSRRAKVGRRTNSSPCTARLPNYPAQPMTTRTTTGKEGRRTADAAIVRRRGRAARDRARSQAMLFAAGATDSVGGPFPPAPTRSAITSTHTRRLLQELAQRAGLFRGGSETTPESSGAPPRTAHGNPRHPPTSPPPPPHPPPPPPPALPPPPPHSEATMPNGPLHAETSSPIATAVSSVLAMRTPPSRRRGRRGRGPSVEVCDAPIQHDARRLLAPQLQCRREENGGSRRGPASVAVCETPSPRENGDTHP